MNPARLTESLKAEARRLGFSVAGATPAVAPPQLGRLRAWVASGRAGSMRFFAERAEAYAHPRHILDGVRSILMLGLGYRSVEPVSFSSGGGRVARCAWGTDYHKLVGERLRALADWHRALTPAASVRGVVDTAPLLEREFGRLAGLGWIGRNSCLVHPRLGSWFFLAALLTTEELAPDAPLAENHCGTCRACLAACPTGAIQEDGHVDARRCVSYLTIEHAGPIPLPLRPKLGDRLFGCDACQEVCPWNRRAPATGVESLAPREGANPADLAAILAMDEAAFRERFADTPLAHARRRRVLRNAAVLLGNRAHAAALPVLVERLDDEEPLVRGACAWALGQHAGREARQALQQRLSVETDADVRREIELAISPLPPE